MTTPTKEEQFINQGGGVVVTSVLLWQYFILLFLINIAPVPASLLLDLLQLTRQTILKYFCFLYLLFSCFFVCCLFASPVEGAMFTDMTAASKMLPTRLSTGL